MKALTSFLFGVLISFSAILLHQLLPPLGIALSLFITYYGIWILGRKYGARRYKAIAALAWAIVLYKASSFGVGKELLVQGDGRGTALLFIGLLLALSSIAARV